MKILLSRVHHPRRCQLEPSVVYHAAALHESCSDQTHLLPPYLLLCYHLLSTVIPISMYMTSTKLETTTYCTNATIGLSHDHRYHVQKIWCKGGFCE